MLARASFGDLDLVLEHLGLSPSKEGIEERDNNKVDPWIANQFPHLLGVVEEVVGREQVGQAVSVAPGLSLQGETNNLVGVIQPANQGRNKRTGLNAASSCEATEVPHVAISKAPSTFGSSFSLRVKPYRPRGRRRKTQNRKGLSRSETHYRKRRQALKVVLDICDGDLEEGVVDDLIVTDALQIRSCSSSGGR